MHNVSPHWQGCNDTLHRNQQDFCPGPHGDKESVMHPQSSSQKREKEFCRHTINLLQN